MAVHRQLTPEAIRFCPLCGGALSREVVPPEGKPEMVCTQCRFVFYLNHKVVAGTIPAEDGRILLTRRAISPDQLCSRSGAAVVEMWWRTAAGSSGSC